MPHIIYRKSDRAIVGHVFDLRTETETAKELATELNNILNSELGGSAEDYGYVTAREHKRPGHVTSIGPDLTVQFRPDERSKDRASALSKLQKLGLTQSEIAAII
jgi:hypothetical protein